MSKFTVEFTLKQHTPIIHFQSEQKGATLRATELKPKFDRFLKEFVFKENIPKEFLIAKQENALDYKVRIFPKVSKVKTIDPRDPLFFGNMGDGAKKKFVNNEAITLFITTFNPKLLKTIEENFEAFMAMTNFGTRQSKGYGSFYIEGKKFNPDLIPFKVYSFSVNNWKKDLKLFYSFLRQGINLPIINKNTKGKIGTKFYSKPAIFSYAKRKGWTWDKKAIKHHYFKNKIKDQKGEAVEYQTHQKYLLRDLFGLSVSQKWGKPYNVDIEKEDIEYDTNNKPIIERFKSPITFKVIDKKIYFWADYSVEEILNKTFKIKCNNRGNLQLDTPSEFSFEDFFQEIFKINLSNYIDPKYHNDRNGEFKTLEKIFKELKASL